MPTKSRKATKRLRRGELNGLVLVYMGKHKEDGPLTASAIGKGIGRSSGAVANCLARLTKDKRVRQAKRKPRAYALKAAKHQEKTRSASGLLYAWWRGRAYCPAPFPRSIA